MPRSLTLKIVPTTSTRSSATIETRRTITTFKLLDRDARGEKPKQVDNSHAEVSAREPDQIAQPEYLAPLVDAPALPVEETRPAAVRDQVVPYVLRPEVGEGDRVLDEDGVLLRPGHERAALALGPALPQRQLVHLDGTPGLHLARVRVGRNVGPYKLIQSI